MNWPLVITFGLLGLGVIVAGAMVGHDLGHHIPPDPPADRDRGETDDEQLAG